MQVIRYERQYDKGCLNAFFAIYIEQWKLTVSHMCEFVKGDRRWIYAPSYSQEIDGKRTFYPYVSFDSHTHERFLEEARKALDLYLETQVEKGEEEDIPF